MDDNSAAGGKYSFSTLQHLLQLSYSDDPEQQQKAAIDISKFVEGTVFPVVSFGPLSHALCRLLPSKNRTVASYSARAIKLLLLDDALRPQTVVAGVPTIVCASFKYWNEEVLCLHELMGALQTLCWDKLCVKSVIQSDIIIQLIKCIDSDDQEVSVLAIATLANIYSFADTILLSDVTAIEALTTAIPTLLEILRTSQSKPQRFYSIAAVANASSHPRLVSTLNENGALQLCKEIERESLANMHVLGSRMCECSQTAIFRLGDKRDISNHYDTKIAVAKYSFKWGNKPVMELSLASISKYKNAITFCFIVWLCIVLFTFLPIFGI